MGSPIRVLHTAGFRFDSPSWAGPSVWAGVRNQDLWQTFEAVLTLCRTERVDFLFLVGDLFDQDYVRKVTVERVAKSLAKLAGTRVFITPGARDPMVVTSAYRLAVWPSNVHIFSGGISRVEIPALNAVVYGAGWTAYRQKRPFLDGFRANKDGALQLMLLHAEIESDLTDGFIPVSQEQIASSGLLYLALGHQEVWSGIQQAGETFWADCGSPAVRGFHDNGPHGVVLAELQPASSHFEFRELEQRRYIEETLAWPVRNLEDAAKKLWPDTNREERQRNLFRVRLAGRFEATEREVETTVQTLQTLLAAKLRYVEVLAAESDLAREFSSTVRAAEDLKLTPGLGNRHMSGADGIRSVQEGFPTLGQVFASQIKARLAQAEGAEEQAHWDLVQKIGLAALGQGRVDNEN